MAPRMDALVLQCVTSVLFLCITSVSGHSSGYSYTREELLNHRTTTPVDLLPIFVASAADLLQTLIRKLRRRKRGKRAGALVRLRRRGLRTALPGIFLSNVRSLRNKTDELALMRSMNRDFASSCVLCFTETWLCEDIPDSALKLEGFHLLRADRQASLSGKTKGGGVCFYINSGWCTDVTVIAQHCSSSLEYLFIHCKPFYSPREFASFILAAVYIPPDGCAGSSVRTRGADSPHGADIPGLSHHCSWGL
ncbi:uncharacterized protein LOC121813023 [Haplochromis burtoni]|uniref:uncharacterized protein LOC121813023 n=1 Tax=Haplochromis burtoni TaxID=8153 RepID=UPI001C2D9AA2|nr:uncharacterized protein LOC121813023 [Haplochromis burtoni]